MWAGGGGAGEGSRGRTYFPPEEGVGGKAGGVGGKGVGGGGAPRPPLQRAPAPRVGGRAGARPQAPPGVPHEKEDAERDPEGADGRDQGPEGEAGVRRGGGDAARDPDRGAGGVGGGGRG